MPELGQELQAFIVDGCVAAGQATLAFEEASGGPSEHVTLLLIGPQSELQFDQSEVNQPHIEAPPWPSQLSTSSGLGANEEQRSGFSPGHVTFLLLVPMPQPPLQGLQGPACHKQPLLAEQACTNSGVVLQSPWGIVHVPDRCCVPSPQVLLHFPQSERVQPQPSMVLQVWVLGGAAPEQSAELALGQKTCRVWTPEPQSLEQADQLEMRQPQPAYAVQF